MTEEDVLKCFKISQCLKISLVRQCFKISQCNDQIELDNTYY